MPIAKEDIFLYAHYTTKDCFEGLWHS